MASRAQNSFNNATAGASWVRRHLFTSALVVYYIISCNPAFAADKIISAETAYRLSTNGELILIDIRTPKEWAESGIPKGAQAITMHNPKGKRAFLDAIRSAVGGDSASTIALICAVGGRSRWAQRFLTKNGFTNVVDVSEGMFGHNKKRPGWIKRGLPIEPCSPADPAAVQSCQAR